MDVPIFLESGVILVLNVSVQGGGDKINVKVYHAFP